MKRSLKFALEFANTGKRACWGYEYLSSCVCSGASMTLRYGKLDRKTLNSGMDLIVGRNIDALL